MIVKKVISVIEEKVGTAHNPSKIILDDICEYYLKAPKDQSPELSIIKEFLTSLLLDHFLYKKNGKPIINEISR